MFNRQFFPLTAAALNNDFDLERGLRAESAQRLRGVLQRADFSLGRAVAEFPGGAGRGRDGRVPGRPGNAGS